MSTTLEEQLQSIKNEAKRVAQEKASREAPVRVQKLDKVGRSYGTGRCKESVARVWIKPGSGVMAVNGKPLAKSFSRLVLQTLVLQPFVVSGRAGRFDVFCTVKGGGVSGQARAVRHGISRALVDFEPDLRPYLKKAGLLTRDPREVERKKFGHPKARKSFQFSKR